MRGLDRIFRFRTSVQAVKSIFNPKSLFATGAPGLWYDLSLTDGTLFQNVVGTIPVTAVEQPVGLVLDKSKGLALGPELVTNGDFSNGTTGWGTLAATITAAEGACVVTATGAYAGVGRLLSTAIGKTYKVSVDLKQHNAGIKNVFLYVGPNISNGLYGSKIIGSAPVDNSYFIFTATTTTVVVSVAGGSNFVSGDSFTVDNISVRELPGNHAFQTTSASRPVLSARYNLLTATEAIGGPAWPTKSGSFVLNAGSSPTGTNTATLHTATTTDPYVYQSVVLSAGVYIFKVWVKGVGSSIGKQGTLRCGGHISSNFELTPDWRLCTTTFTVTAGTFNTGVEFPESAVIGDQVYVWGADLRVANDGVGLPPYQRVNTATDYDTVGFPLYLRFNGSTQFLQTNSIDFSSTDKVLVAAGVRKLSDAAVGVVAELSANAGTTAGAFWILGPNSANAANYNFRSSGTLPGSTANYTNSGVAAPVTSVLGAQGNISGKTEILRLNGIQVAAATSNQGTGNYGNYPLYIGARADTALFFNGRLYSLIIAGIKPTDAQILGVETYINKLTKAY